MTFKKGVEVWFSDENDQPRTGSIIGYGDANDGTGRHGWYIRTKDGSVYWRKKPRLTPPATSLQ